MSLGLSSKKKSTANDRKLKSRILTAAIHNHSKSFNDQAEDYNNKQRNYTNPIETDKSHITPSSE